MNDESILIIIYSVYTFIQNREYFFIFIYSGLILSNIFKLIYIILFYKIKFGKRLLILLEYFFIYIISYFLIKDPNPFYYLFTFYLPLPNFFRGIFLVIFITYSFNNRINNIEMNDNKIKTNDNGKENEEKTNTEEEIKEVKDKNKKEIKKIETFFLYEYFIYFS